ncbi:unnamed protein product [Adineta ricciae]|uniref:F-box domain-containing protein n=1 Tax=Adineta ricciae TaxID=249248 RepID=A0A814S0F2_ADIRI|nr:unnamed protein product [Adineta ricciae]
MSVDSSVCLQELPDLVFYQILDQLDIHDILLSLRRVSRHFYNIVNSYNRLKLKIISTSPRAGIHRISRTVQSGNVLSISLMNTMEWNQWNGVQVFVSLNNLSQYTCLRSLSLFYIDMDVLENMLQEVTSLPALVSLTIEPGKINNLIERLAMLLSSAIARSNLRKLSLYAMCGYISRISWSKQCKLKELFLDSCSHNHICHILDQLPNLETFTTHDYWLPIAETPIVLTSIHLLTSLKLYCMQIPIGLLESLLSYMPALVHLHLSTYFTTFYFLQRLSQWEYLIHEKLPVLDTFKLYASTEQYQYEDVKDIESMFNRFRTPFWLELKRWYITCEYVKDGNTSNIRLYSRKDSHRNFPAKSSPAMLTHSASTTRNDDITDMSGFKPRTTLKTDTKYYRMSMEY